jgi:hypothetical protein
MQFEVIELHPEINIKKLIKTRIFQICFIRREIINIKYKPIREMINNQSYPLGNRQKKPYGVSECVSPNDIMPN